MERDTVKQPLRIVHLEDDPNDQILVQEALRQDAVDCELTTVSTREDFVATLQQGPIDLILSDYGLPNFDGLSALALASRMVPHTPFILVSGTLGEEAAI